MMTVTNHPDRHRYVIDVDGAEAGYSEYFLKPGVVVFTHTVVDPAFGGQGVGSTLARGVLDDSRAQGLRVVPQCPFIHAFIDKHPEYADLVAS
jgi:predicted GNAT family acetyltransferase